ncbi:methyltransferase family protein [Pyruvatibacter mobilis]|uniref:methyltransferase family protein n=1 Tax=Pyruvatibacter mobilis TaxID=1712261 RepID=UPI003BAF06CE
MKRLLPPVLWALCLIVMLVLAWRVPAAQFVAPPYHLIGWAVAIIGCAFTILGSRHFARVRTEINTFGTPGRLVTGGLFQFSRNPMYLGFFLALLGTAIGLNTLPALAPPLVFFLAAQFWYIPYEEKMAEATFGQPYMDYKRSVRRWI